MRSLLVVFPLLTTACRHQIPPIYPPPSQALESIFVGSADIRVQLPEDSKRFAAVNADYQARRLLGGGTEDKPLPAVCPVFWDLALSRLLGPRKWFEAQSHVTDMAPAITGRLTPKLLQFTHPTRRT